MTTSFDFHPWKIQTRAGRRTPYRVRWTVAGRQFGTSFVTMALAESFRASLITTARKGEGFDTDSGLPESMERTRRDISFYQHAEQFTAAAWPAAAAKTRVSIIETLGRVVPVVVRDLAGAPDRDTLRRALQQDLLHRIQPSKLRLEARRPDADGDGQPAAAAAHYGGVNAITIDKWEGK